MSSGKDPLDYSSNVNNCLITKQEPLNGDSINSCGNTLNTDSVEVKLEIELKEGTGEFVSTPEFDGHLQFVTLNSHIPDECNTTDYEHSGISQWNCDQNTLSSPSDIRDVSTAEENEESDVTHVYGQLKNVTCDISKNIYVKEEFSEMDLQASSSTSSIVYDCSSESSWREQFDCQKQKERCWISMSEAEKKKYYRQRIKEENPEMWSAIKMIDRCKKKEQREEKRLILLEMQKTRELISSSDPAETESHEAHLQALKDRYPELWLQLEHADAPRQDIFLNSGPLDEISLKKHWASLTEAEKKRYYRRRIKEENPEMWSAIKLKDACKKREQREEKRHVLLEMQKTMELISNSDSTEVENHKAHLQALKERYPDLWQQLESAMAATEMRSRGLMFEKGNRGGRRVPKPLNMYKDVVEAHKKFLYRQRLKQERPEYYAQMKARDTYAKSIKRMMMKTGACVVQNEFSEFIFHG